MLAKCHVSRNTIKTIELELCHVSLVLEELSRYASVSYKYTLCDFMITHTSSTSGIIVGTAQDKQEW